MESQLTKHFTYSVVEARLVSSFFTCPSKAIPFRSLLFAKSGVKYMTFWTLEPGWMGHPSLVSIEATVFLYWPFWKRTTSTPCCTIALIFFTTCRRNLLLNRVKHMAHKYFPCSNCFWCSNWLLSSRHENKVVCLKLPPILTRLDSTWNLSEQWCRAEHQFSTERIEPYGFPRWLYCVDGYGPYRFLQQKSSNFITLPPFIKDILAFVYLNEVLNPTWISHFFTTLLQGHWRWSAWLKIECKWNRISSQFFDQTLLKFRRSEVVLLR